MSSEPGAVVVRAATAADVPAILPLVRAICDQHAQWDKQRFDFKPDVVERYAQWLPERASDASSVLLVAQVSGGAQAARIVGYIVGTTEQEVPIYWTPACGYIHDVYIEPVRRGAGAGLALVNGAIERFAGMGLKQVRLITAAQNDAGRRLFTRAGMRVATVEMMKMVGE
jgi:ribosomal protein S18 acetylase RimI-like enzyme